MHRTLAPAAMNKSVCHDALILGHYKSGADQKPIFLTAKDRDRHLWVLGQTGSGKTSFLYSLIMQDIICGRGLCLIDPHGDLADHIIDSIPKHRTRDIVILDPSDVDYPVGLNILADMPPHLRASTVSGLIASLRSIWSDSWGPRMEHILANTLALLLEQPRGSGASLLSITPCLTDTKFRKRLLRHCKDPIVRDFWETEFASYDKRAQSEYVVPILNKVAAFARNPVMRQIIGQRSNRFSLQKIMDSKKVLIAKLSKGLLTEHDTNLFGSLLVCAIQQEAMRRAAQREEERVPFALYLDEFQNFTTDAFETIVSEARKYRLSLVCAHQYSEQIKPTILSAIIGNMGTLAIFTISGTDAERLAVEFHPMTSTSLRDYSGLGRMVIKWTSGGQQTKPFYAHAIHGDMRCGSRDKIYRCVRRQYCAKQEH